MHFSISMIFNVYRHFPGPTVCISHFPRNSVFLLFLGSKVSVTYFLGIFSFLALFQVLQCAFLFFYFFHCFLPYSRSYIVCVSFYTFFSSLSIVQVLQCVFLIFHLFTLSRHIPCPTVCVSNFSRLPVFSQNYNFYSEHFSLFMFFSFLAIFYVLQCVCLLFHVFQFSRHTPCPYSVLFSFSTFFQYSRHIPGPTMSISHFPIFSVFPAIFQVKQCLFLIFHVSVFSPYSKYYSVFFSFCTFFSVSRHITGLTVCVSHFPRFSVFSPNYNSYTEHFSFSTFFSISPHIPGHRMFVCHFPRFSVFSPFSRSYSVYSHFLRFSIILAIFQDLQCVFLILHVFQCFSPYSRSYSLCFSISTFFSFLSKL